MEYRTLPHGDEKIGVIGLGMAGIHQADARETETMVREALDAGVNVMDFIPSEASAFEGYLRALSGANRQRAMLQVHIGAEYTTGKYGWTTDAKLAAAEFEKRLSDLGTDYADFGFIHCIDEDADFDKIMNGGIWDYAQRRKADGTIRHLAFSTHTTSIARKFLATEAFDWAMFSINPMYDYTNESTYGKGEASDRATLYREFEAAGVGVSVMKAFAGGQLLDATQSPFSQALTREQCIAYALDKPSVTCVLPGVRGLEDLHDVLSYLDASPEQRDYSIIGEFAPPSDKGTCVYCNHCQPCPVGIPIGLANKYYDLARLGDELAVDHYRNLEHRASECVQCGHCDTRCPFGCGQSNRMAEIAEYFGV